jgi:hypothetical protein
MRTKGNAASGPNLRRCRHCKGSFPSGSLVAGDCPACAGLTPLPLRGEGGKFIKFTVSAPTGNEGGTR